MTVYDYCHIGHARVMVAFDVIVRHLRYRFNNVVYVRNITDIDDKIIEKAKQSKEDIFILTQKYIDLMHEDEKALGVLSPDIEPKATDYIEEMQQLIKVLIQKGLAYKGKNGDIYYRINNFDNYGKLSGKKLTDLIAGNRVDVADDKENSLDFVLWKNIKTSEIKWQSDWGDGRPGWHIECSAMSNYHLGNKFDIHGGGFDLIFPHHENEIAQSEGAHNCNPANYWMHVGFVNIDGDKMSKSLNNFFTIKDVLTRYDGEIIRYFILSSHYRSPLHYSEMNLIQAKKSLMRLYVAIKNKDTTATKNINNEYTKLFDKAMDDDFNTPKAIAVLFELAKVINISNNAKQQKLIATMVFLGKRLGILQNPNFLVSGVKLDDATIKAKIQQRNVAKNNKNYVLADQIRKELKNLGVILEDNQDGTIWRRS